MCWGKTGRAILLGALLLPLATVAGVGIADENGKYWISSESIRAAFIPYGAAITDFIIKDQRGIPRDIVAGFDNASYYEVDKQHPYFGGVPGRYANRIKNSSFEIDGVGYKVLANDHPTAEHPDGLDTLHGGPKGWDRRNFTVVAHTNNSITFSILDPDGEQGFPGEVMSFITYTLSGMNWEFQMVATATTKKTPIMITSHTYWNLDGFANDQSSTALNHTFYMPYGGARVEVDDILIPTGNILANEKGSPNDFWSRPKQLGADLNNPKLRNNCGADCTGYDNCYLVNREQLEPYNWRTEGFVARLYSAWSGIQLDIYSDQDAFQMYSCNFQNGSMALKKTQGLFDNPAFPRTIQKYGCVVLEVQDYIDGINHPEWKRDKKQIFGPGDDPFILRASYRFSINSTTAAG